MNIIYIASCDKDGGIYRCLLQDNGSIEIIEKTLLDRPMYMTVKNDKMYIILRSPFKESNDSGVIIYDIGDDGKLINPSEIISTKGEVACHIAVEENDIYCANYISGSVIKIPDILVTHKGCGIHSTRQTSPHTHFVGFTPDKKYLCVVDLGLDTIFLYNKDLTLHSKSEVPKGHGARHIVFSDNGKYMFCANELKSALSAFSYDNGKLKLIDTISVLPDEYTAENTTAAIRVFNDKVYVSNRGHNSVSEVSFVSEKLMLEKCIDCKGKSPRDFDFIDNKMICTNEDSDDVCVFDALNDFVYIGSYKFEKPLCILS